MKSISKNTISLLTIFVIIALLICGCVEFTPDENDNKNNNDGNIENTSNIDNTSNNSYTNLGLSDIFYNNNLSLSLYTNKENYEINETVHISIVITNNGKKNITLTLNDPLSCRFEIFNEEGQSVYFNPGFEEVNAMTMDHYLPVGETKALGSDSWNSSISGVYSITGQIVDGPICNNTAKITIKDN